MLTFKTIVWRNLLGIFIAIVLLCMLFSQCSEKHRLQTNLTALTSKNAIYKNQLGTQTIQNARLLITNDELQKTIIDKDQNIKILSAGFSSINNITTIKTITKTDTIKIPFDVPAPCNFVREGAIFKDWYSLGYKVDSLGITIEPITIPNEQIIITGFKRKWFLGKTTAVTEVTNTNPLIEIQDVHSFETVVPKHWYDSKLLWLTVGLLTSAILIK
jgi:hypothetical protein